MSKIINSLRKRFTQIPNSIVTDISLSDGALRVFLYMSTKPDDWQFNNRDIQCKLNIKRAETIAKYWKELINSGWISRQPVLNDNGKPSGYFDYLLNFEPQIPTPQNAEVVLPTTDKPDTVNQQLRKNRSYTNKEISTNKEITNTPYNPPAANLSRDSGIAGVWLGKINFDKFGFSADEITAILELANHMAKFESLSDKQISLNLEIMADHKKSGYDLIRMIRNSIAKNYRGLMEPTKAFLISTIKPVLNTGRYPATGYITPENQSQKYELRNYLERCYLRDMVDPRNGLALSGEQKSLLKAHFDFAKSKRIGITDYIYQTEVLTGKCLLEQSISGLAASFIDVAA